MKLYFIHILLKRCCNILVRIIKAQEKILYIPFKPVDVSDFTMSSILL